ncbi:PepSY-associated TM helix domain-containing protein [Thalassospira marina]|uniref:PepSY domain-containing protein n=1 Tax=Thalassospira marina TaxID=2048283 RepID=A0A2N3KD65_9PROT|nr:PepSY domain-containing protein [Thalassospira marina]PKR48436.1 hypothetical protein COO20_24540 [Thalassospira marina]
MSTQNAATHAQPNRNPNPNASRNENRKFYMAAWRWHFYAGIFVIPFLLILATTGMVMMVFTGQSNQLGHVSDIVPTGQPLPVSQQAKAALATLPDGHLDQYISPEAPNRPAFFAIRNAGAVIAVAVNPYSGEILNSQDSTTTLYAIANDIHGSLMIGDTGDRIMEAAASLTLLLIITGLWMWLPKAGLKRAFIPEFSAKGRAFWKSLHAVFGTWVSAILVLFILSGLAWSGIWGDKYIQPWSAFPAEKWDNIPLSDLNHRSLNHGPLDEVPWGLETTRMPMSGSQAGATGISQPVTLDTVAQWANSNGFSGQYKVSLPKGDTGVYTLMAEARNEDSVDPSNDRTLHIDRYTGNILADIRYQDYSPVAKLMAWGIGLHKGLAGTWNFALNFVVLLTVITICLSGIVMWWKRRPTGAGRLVAPPMPEDITLWKGAIVTVLALSLAFPMAGFTLLGIIALDFMVLSRIPALKRAIS